MCQVTREAPDRSAATAPARRRDAKLPFAVVATDLDGTLLTTQRTVSAFTARVLGDLTAAGVHLVFVTGRPIRWMHQVVEATGHRGLAVCSNGGVVLDLATMTVIDHTDIPATVLSQLIDAIGADVAGVSF